MAKRICTLLLLLLLAGCSGQSGAPLRLEEGPDGEDGPEAALAAEEGAGEDTPAKAAAAGPDEKPEVAPHGLLPAMVDMLEPFDFTDETGGLRPADMGYLRVLLLDELEDRGGYQVVGHPKITLPNIAQVRGKMSQYSLRNYQGAGLYYRVVDAAITLEVSFPYEPPPGRPPIVIQRAISFQKIYAGRLELPDERGDTNAALKELAAMLAAGLVPPPGPLPPINLALDPHSGHKLAQPLLAKGNRMYQGGFPQKAMRLWRLALFTPLQSPPSHLYRVNRRGLDQLAAQGFDQETLARLEKLAVNDPEPFDLFRERLKRSLEGSGKLDQVIKASEWDSYLLHANMAAAHENLAVYYQSQRQNDLAAYHLSMAWAHGRRPDLLERWAALQQKRRLIPDGMDDGMALSVYQRIPPPTNLRMFRGEKENSLFNPLPLAFYEKGLSGNGGPPPPALPPVKETGGRANGKPPVSPAPAAPPAAGEAEEGAGEPLDNGALNPAEQPEAGPPAEESGPLPDQAPPPAGTETTEGAANGGPAIETPVQEQ